VLLCSWNLLYVNPSTGIDAGGRGSLARPFRTFGFAFRTIPAYTPLTRGYRILIARVRRPQGIVTGGRVQRVGDKPYVAKPHVAAALAEGGQGKIRVQTRGAVT
jgi:hypothetical protein